MMDDVFLLPAASCCVRVYDGRGRYRLGTCTYMMYYTYVGN